MFCVLNPCGGFVWPVEAKCSTTSCGDRSDRSDARVSVSSHVLVVAESSSVLTSSLALSQTEYARFENGRFVYRISRSPMCEYMINFVHKLKHLPEKYMMNSVLENFTILLVSTSAPQP